MMIILIKYSGRLLIKDTGFIYKSFRNKTNQVIWDFCFHKTGLRNESTNRIFQKQSTKQIHKTNLLKPVWICMKPRICMDSGLFKVRLCTKDLSGFVRIRWIRENRLNLLKISLENKSTKQIF
jgi:hypothetical protein